MTEIFQMHCTSSPVAQDETPCATRSSSADPLAEVAAANRSSCSAYLKKPGARYAYVRDEHCCLCGPIDVFAADSSCVA